MKLLVPADFAYGNTRLRARRGALLRRADYERLADLDIDALGEALAPGAEHGNGPGVGLARLHEAIRTQLGQSLEQMRSFYAGRARELVDVALARFDTHNVVTVLRALSLREQSAPDALAALVPVGWLRGPLAAQVLRLHEPAAVIDLLARSTPDRNQAATLRAALGDYERSEDLAALERTVVADGAARVATTLASAGPGAATMLRFARRQIDERNLLIALRARAAVAAGAHAGAAPGDPLLPGGSMPLASFTSAIHAPAPGAVVARLGAAAGGRWRSALQSWAASGDLNDLQRTLERKTITDRMALFGTGDPLGVDIPLAFSAAAQAQARNLRLLGEATARHISADVVRRELLWSDQP